MTAARTPAPALSDAERRQVTYFDRGQPAPESAGASQPGKATRVTAVEVAPHLGDLIQDGLPESTVVRNDYVLITDGTCHVAGVVAHSTGTHVITVKGRKE